MTPRIFCIGRNYAEHIAELNNEVPSEPVIFIKPLSSLGDNGQYVPYPRHGQQFQYEAEVVLQIGQAGRPEHVADAQAFISAVTLGIDFTLRDVQQRLKDQGLPWEKAKAFDDSARIGAWVPMSDQIDLAGIEFTCQVNQQVKQHGHTKMMLRNMAELVYAVGSIWSLVPGDMIFTGTPKGVGELACQDVLTISAQQLGIEHSFIIE